MYFIGQVIKQSKVDTTMSLDAKDAHVTNITNTIESCVEYKNQILGLFFQDKIKTDDVLELVQTAQKVEVVLK